MCGLKPSFYFRVPIPLKHVCFPGLLIPTSLFIWDESGRPYFSDSCDAFFWSCFLQKVTRVNPSSVSRYYEKALNFIRLYFGTYIFVVAISIKPKPGRVKEEFKRKRKTSKGWCQLFCFREKNKPVSRDRKFKKMSFIIRKTSCEPHALGRGNRWIDVTLQEDPNLELNGICTTLSTVKISLSC